MNVIRIRKRFDSPIPQLPELTPLIGTDLEIIVLAAPDEAEPQGAARDDFWQPRSLDELALAQGVGPVASLEKLRGKEVGDALDGFEQAVNQWRREPWRAGGE